MSYGGAFDPVLDHDAQQYRCGRLSEQSVQMFANLGHCSRHAGTALQ